MQKQILLFIILLFIGFSSCSKPKKKLTVSRYDPAATSFAFLNEPLKDVRILALGESSHGFGSMHAMKGNLIKYLNQELGYDVLVMEAGYADLGLAWFNEDNENPVKIINGALNANLRSKQMMPLVEYLFEKKETETPIHLRGMDPRVSAFAFRFRLRNVIGRLEPKVIQDSIQNGMDDYKKVFEVLDDKEQWQKYMDSYRSTLAFAKSILVDGREDIKELEIAEYEEVDMMIRYFDMLEAAVDYEFGETYTKGLSLRDSLMAENVIRFAEEEFPNAKIIIWGHNGHIEKAPGEGDNIKWMGHYLKERYKDKYYSLGMFAKEGFIYQTKDRKTSNFNISDPKFIEAKIFNDYGPNFYLDLPKYDVKNTSWFHSPIDGYELEAGGRVRFIPSKRFDGVLLLGKTEAPDYLINPDNPRKRE